MAQGSLMDSILIIFGLLFRDDLDWRFIDLRREIDVESKTIGMDFHIRERF
jgi:hypothetical protein